MPNRLQVSLLAGASSAGWQHHDAAAPAESRHANAAGSGCHPSHHRCHRERWLRHYYKDLHSCTNNVFEERSGDRRPGRFGDSFDVSRI